MTIPSSVNLPFVDDARARLSRNSVCGRPHRSAQYCADLVVHGRDDWYLPALEELVVLQANRAAIGEFSTDYYWSSSEVNDSSARSINFGDGAVTNTGKDADWWPGGNVRCVRK